MATKCNRCGEPISWFKDPNTSKWRPRNHDKSDHLDTCPQGFRALKNTVAAMIADSRSATDGDLYQTADEQAEEHRDRNADAAVAASRRLTTVAAASGDRLTLIKAAALRARIARTGNVSKPSLVTPASTSDTEPTES